jgi:hypothetical protein
MSSLRSALALGAGIALAGDLAAQSARWQRLVAIGDDLDDRARLAQLAYGAPVAGYLLRSAATLSRALPGDSTRLRWALLLPEVTTVANSALPFSLNDGALWAGRGWNERFRAGARLDWGRWFLVVAPELLLSENTPYELAHPLTVPDRPPLRHPLSSPWHLFPSIDVPLRFGERGFVTLDPGQSTLGVRLGAVVAGVSTENEWWGPGIRNAIVMSSNAGGIPRVFARTARPLRTPIGTLEGRWFLGALSESRYFDFRPEDDRRSMSGVAIAWQPDSASGLSLGVARTVYAHVDDWWDLSAHVLDVLRDRGARPSLDSGALNTREQIFAVFGRWVFPADRFALHFEWARTDLPYSIRDLLTSPNHSQGYTVGIEWATPVRDGRDLVRFQAEVTYLERSPSYRDRPEDSFYTSRSVAQGYTQRGQVIGAAIGPGASSQWVGVDYVAPTWRVGVFGGRIRWDDDALYTFPTPPTALAPNKWCAHDVSLFAGVMGAVERTWGRLRIALTRGERLNVFFHNLTQCDLEPDPLPILDARNTTLEVRFTPALTK